MHTAFSYSVGHRRAGRRMPPRDRAPHGRFAPRMYLLQPRAQAVMDLHRAAPDWPGLWNRVQSALRTAGYRRSTLFVYRQVLRALRRHLEHQHGADSPLAQPAAVTAAAAGDYLHGLTDRHTSWSWLSVNIAVLRTAFDKLGGQTLTAHMATPKRPLRLADTVSSDDVALMIEAAPTLRDRLLLGLLYGCGLKVGEASRVRWTDVDLAAGQLTVSFAGNTRQRRIALPQALRPLLAAGLERCDPEAYVFAGAAGEHTPLSTRTAQRIVRRAAGLASIGKPVCAMTLRHGYGVDRLTRGANVAQVQESLGHLCIKTTLQYQRRILPAGIVSPADRLPASVVGVECSSAAPPLPPSQPAVATSESATPPLPPITQQVLRVPFAHIADGSREFYALLKARLTSRFLALRAPRQLCPVLAHR